MAGTRSIRDTARTTRTRSMSVVLAAAFATLLGVFLIYGVGFAGSNVMHNAAHDSRHSLTFPCH
jgi:cobalt transporter subunit CbtB